MRLRYISTLILALLATYSASSQIKYVPPTAHSFSVGIGYGVAKLYGDFYGKPQTGIPWGDINYNITPYLSAGIQGQAGKLITGGLNVTTKANGFYTTNTYQSAAANVRLSLGAFLVNQPESVVLDLISGIYGGAGIGIMNNTITISERGGLNETYLLHGAVKTVPHTANIPLNVGIDVNVPQILGYNGLQVNVNYQYNFCQSDNVDGYDPQVPFNKHNDVYTYISAGLRFNFGRIR